MKSKLNDTNRAYARCMKDKSKQTYSITEFDENKDCIHIVMFTKQAQSERISEQILTEHSNLVRKR